MLARLALIAALSLPVALLTPASAQTPTISEEEAHDIGVDAYLYFYPLVTMDLTRLQSTNVEAGAEPLKGPMNAFVNASAYPSADFKTVVRPNFDTLYSIAWLDLTEGPMVVSVPDTQGRYYLLPMLDMWTDVFSSPGWRTTGTQAQSYLVTPPGWDGVVPADIAQVKASTPYVWIIGRIKTDGPADYDAVHKIQAELKIAPLLQMGTDWTPPPAKIDADVDMKTPPKEQVDKMSAGDFFAYAAELLKVNPPHFTDGPILARMKRIGIEPGKSFDIQSVDPEIRNGLQRAPKSAQDLMAWKTPTLARVVNNWSMNTDTMGVYGNYYLKRAIVAQLGLGANVPQDAVYPLNQGDKDGKPLDGANNYTIHFDRSEIPPVEAFWSITLYGPEGFQVGNPLNRFALSSWMPFTYNDDGSLDLYIQNASPGKEREANWLPAPKGPFNLTMRLYAPKSEALTGKWNPPPVVTRAQEVAQRTEDVRATGPAQAAIPLGLNKVKDDDRVIARWNLRVEDVEDMRVDGPDGKRIGEVEEVLEGPDGEIRAVVLEYGGFLGLGAKQVIVDLDKLQLGQDRQLTTNLSEDQLDALPSWSQ
jgi:hypothetical protein